MSVATDALFWGFISTALSAMLLFFCFRAYRRSGQRGFLLLALALVVLPTVEGFVNRPLIDWVRDQGGTAQTYGMVVLIQRAIAMILVSAALILLARPLHRGRRP